MNLTKEEKKRMKGLQLVTSPWDEKEPIEISKNLNKIITRLCKTFKIKKQNFIEEAIVNELQKENSKCQVKECSHIAAHIKEEVFEFDHRNINGKMKQIQLCVIKTPLCDTHRESLEASQGSKVSYDTL